jgi:hypothetical protein
MDKPGNDPVGERDMFERFLSLIGPADNGVAVVADTVPRATVLPSCLSRADLGVSLTIPAPLQPHRERPAQHR